MSLDDDDDDDDDDGRTIKQNKKTNTDACVCRHRTVSAVQQRLVMLDTSDDVCLMIGFDPPDHWGARV